MVPVESTGHVGHNSSAGGSERGFGLGSLHGDREGVYTSKIILTLLNNIRVVCVLNSPGKRKVFKWVQVKDRKVLGCLYENGSIIAAEHPDFRVLH